MLDVTSRAFDTRVRHAARDIGKARDSRSLQRAVTELAGRCAPAAQTTAPFNNDATRSMTLSKAGALPALIRQAYDFLALAGGWTTT